MKPLSQEQQIIAIRSLKNWTDAKARKLVGVSERKGRNIDQIIAAFQCGYSFRKSLKIGTLARVVFDFWRFNVVPFQQITKAISSAGLFAQMLDALAAQVRLTASLAASLPTTELPDSTSDRPEQPA